jgi:FMN phosphatase YigB (HAD superfamily)
MICALDFDRTLCDTDAQLAQVGILRIQHLIGNPELTRRLGITQFLYDDTLPFLQAHQSHVLYIVSAVTHSYGERATEYQRDRIKRSGVEEYVREILLTGDSKVAALEGLLARYPGERLVFVDDRSDVLTDVYIHFNDVTCVHMARGGAQRMSDTPIPPGVPTISTLAELTSIIRSL